MDRRSFLARLSATLPLAAATTSLSLVTGSADAAKAQPKRAGAGPSSQPVRDRQRLTQDRVLSGTEPAYTPAFLMEDILATGMRRFTNFSGDVSGRWIGALATASSFYGQSFPELTDVVMKIIALQKPDGYFGKVFRYENQDDNDMALLWGNGRLLVGLMEYYQFQPSPSVLAAAKKLGDFLLRIGPDFNTQKKADEFGAAHYGSSYICWTQQTEGLALLYAATKEAKYQDLAVEISKRIERRPGDHVHGYLCSLRGILALYETTGDRTLLKKTQAEWDSVMRSGELVVTGGVPERWSPKRTRTEGCAECDWLRLSLALHRATGDEAHLEAAEKSLFNEVAMNQFSSGDFGHGELNAEGFPAEVPTRAWWCCTLHGMRVFPDVQGSAFRIQGKEAFYDLPIDASSRTGKFSANANSSLATDGTIRIAIASADAHGLTIRKPSWATAVTVSRNGVATSGLRVANVRAGDTLVVRYKMALREEDAGSGRSTLWFGPWLLAANSVENPGYFGEHIPQNQVVRATLKTASEQGVSTFVVPVAASSVQYISAEFPDQPGRLQLRAVAEQTAMAPARWETSFHLRSANEKPMASS